MSVEFKVESISVIQSSRVRSVVVITLKGR